MQGVVQDPRTIVVTGGAGFIGAHTVEALLNQGARVVVVDDLRHASSRPLPTSVELLQLDICSAAAKEAIVAIAPGGILHLAAQGGVNRSWRDPMGDATANVLGTLNILSAAEAAGCRRVVIASSGGALYGQADRLPTPEEQPTAPRSPYGTSKLAAEAYLGTYSRLRGLSGLALRYGNVYGPGQDGTGEAGVVAITCHRLLDGLSPILRGDGKQSRDFVFVGDIARANVKALASDVVGALNVGTGVETSVGEVIGILAQLGGHQGNPETAPLPDGEVPRSCLATGRIQAELGWQANTQLRDGLGQTWEDFKLAADGESQLTPVPATIN